VLAGHRNVYGAPFARINEVQPGALIELVTPRQSFRYRALLTTSVFETDLSILQQPPSGSPARLTLFTCTVPHSWQRIVLIAEAEQEGAEY
jgi:sortase (surface protein transpeptidase)